MSTMTNDTFKSGLAVYNTTKSKNLINYICNCFIKTVLSNIIEIM